MSLIFTSFQLPPAGGAATLDIDRRSPRTSVECFIRLPVRASRVCFTEKSALTPGLFDEHGGRHRVLRYRFQERVSAAKPVRRCVFGHIGGTRSPALRLLTLGVMSPKTGAEGTRVLTALHSASARRSRRAPSKAGT